MKIQQGYRAKSQRVRDGGVGELEDGVDVVSCLVRF